MTPLDGPRRRVYRRRMTFRLRLVFWTVLGAIAGYCALDGLGILFGAMLGAMQAGNEDDVDLFV